MRATSLYGAGDVRVEEVPERLPRCARDQAGPQGYPRTLNALRAVDEITL